MPRSEQGGIESHLPTWAAGECAVARIPRRCSKGLCVQTSANSTQVPGADVPAEPVIFEALFRQPLSGDYDVLWEGASKLDDFV